MFNQNGPQNNNYMQPQYSNQPTNKPNQYTKTNTNSGHAENSFGVKDTLEPIFNCSFAGAHALTFSLVKKVNTAQQQKNDYKENLYFFVSIAPGVGSGADRTYDFKTGKINQKFSVREVISLSETLKYCALGQENFVLPYVKFSKQATVSKSFTIWMGSKTQTINNQNIEIRLINISISSGQNKYTMNLSIADALGLSEYLSKICQKAFDLEFEMKNSGVSIKNPTKVQNQNNFMNIPEPSNETQNQNNFMNNNNQAPFQMPYSQF
jgi:hypothetical protein